MSAMSDPNLAGQGSAKPAQTDGERDPLVPLQIVDPSPPPQASAPPPEPPVTVGKNQPPPKPTSACIDLGHHGRERCVFCGLERGSSGGSDV